MAAFITRYLTRLVDTDLRTNWFVWYAVAGHFDPEVADCAPPYLRIKGCLHLPGEFRRLPRGPVILEPSHPLTGVTCIY